MPVIVLDFLCLCVTLLFWFIVIGKGATVLYEASLHLIILNKFVVFIWCLDGSQLQKAASVRSFF